ncbi:MAG: hypothetical protein EOO46_20345 [Flavobacterium sp.]|nr:MAG: hypothetical protein EOO46_20345 [Flavobacterium sp.]
MILQFSETIPFDNKAILISGDKSKDFQNVVYLSDEEKKDPTILEIRFEYHCSPFKTALHVENLIAVGHENHFYLFDLENQISLLSQEIEGYFAGLYLRYNMFYVSGAYGIYAIDKNGNIAWANNSLGLDGILISQFTENELAGTAEQNPPGDWKPFTISRKTGDLLSLNAS